jgi:hypothetical protein
LAPALVKTFDLGYADLPNAYRVHLYAKTDNNILVGTISTSFGDLFGVFGPPRRLDDGQKSNEWSFKDALNRPFSVADGEVPSELINGPYEFNIYAPSHAEGHDFARWISDRVYAHRLTRDVKFIC